VAELIALPFEIVSYVDQRNHILDGRAHWRHLANTADQSCVAAMSESATGDGDAVCYQVTLGNFVVVVVLTS